MKKLNYILLALLLVSFAACDVLMKAASNIQTNTNTANTNTTSNQTSNSLSNDDVISGLKNALRAGADTAVATLSKTDGFYKDNLVKILLPNEAKVIVDNINSVPGGKNLLENVYLRINRAAEDASSAAKPIFVNAITGMSIMDGYNILKGNTTGVNGFDSTAATNYLNAKTRTELTNAFKPKIDESLNKKIVANVSTNDAWKNLTKAWNAVAPFIGKQTVNTDLSGFVTEKALDGLFYKVGLQERKIRKDPYKWSSSIIQKVFGSIFKKS